MLGAGQGRSRNGCGGGHGYVDQRMVDFLRGTGAIVEDGRSDRDINRLRCRYT